MQFGRLLVAAAVSTAVQAVELTDSSYAGITAGEPFAITWAGAEGDVTLVLLDDTNPNQVQPIETIASGLTGTAYTWTPAETLINGFDYAIRINDAVTSNYGAQFQLVGGATSTPSSTATTVVSASTTAASTATTTSSSSTSVSSTSSSSSTTTSTAPSTTSTSTSASSVTTRFTNSTATTLHSSTSSTPSTTASASGSQTSAPSSANSIASPLALILLTVAALISLN